MTIELTGNTIGINGDGMASFNTRELREALSVALTTRVHKEGTYTMPDDTSIENIVNCMFGERIPDYTDMSMDCERGENCASCPDKNDCLVDDNEGFDCDGDCETCSDNTHCSIDNSIPALCLRRGCRYAGNCEQHPLVCDRFNGEHYNEGV